MRSSAQPDGVIIPQLDAAQAGVQRAQAGVAALQNRVFAQGLTGAASLTAPTVGNLATAVVVSKASGFFVVMASGTMQIGAVEVGGATLELCSNTPSVAGNTITVAGGTAFGGI